MLVMWQFLRMPSRRCILSFLCILHKLVLLVVQQILPIEKSIFWEDLGVARKIYHNLAILPVIHQGPDERQIKARVAKHFPRASTRIFRIDSGQSMSSMKAGEEYGAGTRAGQGFGSSPHKAPLKEGEQSLPVMMESHAWDYQDSWPTLLHKTPQLVRFVIVPTACSPAFIIKTTQQSIVIILLVCPWSSLRIKS